MTRSHVERMPFMGPLPRAEGKTSPVLVGAGGAEDGLTSANSTPACEAATNPGLAGVAGVAGVDPSTFITRGGTLPSKSQAACGSGRMLRPVFESVRITVRLARAISSQRRASASPLRQPVSARKRITAIAGDQLVRDLSLSQRSGQHSVFVVREAPLALVVGKLADMVGWVIRPHAVVHCIGENGAEQTDCASGDPAPATHVGQPPHFASLRPGGGFTLRDRVHKIFDVFAGERSHRQATKKGFYMPLNTSSVGLERIFASSIDQRG